MSTESEDTQSPASDTRERILAEHRQIMELAGRIENTSDPLELLPSLQQLRPLFERHFAREEGLEGLHSSIREHAPQETAAIEQLKEDHRQLLADVAALEAQARACLGGSAGEIGEIRASCGRFVRMLREHEARENDVFLDAIWTDLGQGD